MAKKKKDVVLLKKDIYKNGMLPHRGNLRFLSKVILHNGNGYNPEIIYEVPVKPFWINDHFPDNPMMPGVMLIEIANQAAAIYEIVTNKEILTAGLPILTKIVDAEFKRLVKPGQKLLIDVHKIGKEIERKGSAKRYSFKVTIYSIVNEKIKKEVCSVILEGLQH